MLFYHNYKPRVTCRGEGPIKIRFRRLSDNIKYLICDGGNGNIYHYDNFFEWKDGRRGRGGVKNLLELVQELLEDIIKMVKYVGSAIFGAS